MDVRTVVAHGYAIEYATPRGELDLASAQARLRAGHEYDIRKGRWMIQPALDWKTVRFEWMENAWQRSIISRGAL